MVVLGGRAPADLHRRRHLAAFDRERLGEESEPDDSLERRERLRPLPDHGDLVDEMVRADRRLDLLRRDVADSTRSRMVP